MITIQKICIGGILAGITLLAAAYNSKRYTDKSTIKSFTAEQFPLVNERFGGLEETIRTDIDGDGRPDIIIIFKGENAFYKIGTAYQRIEAESPETKRLNEARTIHGYK